jgi:hypothetical protein
MKNGPGLDPSGSRAGKLAEIRQQIDEVDTKMRQFEKGIERWRSLLRQKQKEISLLSAREQKAGRKPGKASAPGATAPEPSGTEAPGVLNPGPADG